MAFQILALSGGGYRGLYTLEILRRLEQQAGRPIGQCFDLISGTSIGGIIAIGLAMGKTTEEIKKEFVDRGEIIFSKGEKPKWLWQRWRSRLSQYMFPKYENNALRDAIESVIGKDKLIMDAKTRLLIPAVNMTKGRVQMFKTAHNENFKLDKDRRAVDVALATSAAPFYFPMARIEDSYFVDGGVVANAPDLCAIHEAIYFLNREREEISVLSIGTTTAAFSLPTSLGGYFGASQWLENERFVSTMFSTQQQLVQFIVGHQLGDRYVRIDSTPSAEQASDLGLDLATSARRRTLLGMAEGAYQDFCNNARVVEMLKHQPDSPIFFN